MKRFLMTILLALVLSLGIGCASTPQSCVVINNNTGIALSVKENPQTQMYEVWLGYVNTVFGLIPTNRAWSADVPVAGAGARDTAEVLFETNFVNWFCFWNSQGIYQRVAVGYEAVRQPGAVAMFAKADDGTISESTANAIKALATIPYTTATSTDLKAQVVDLGKDAAKKAKIVELLKAEQLTWDKFIDDTSLTDVKLQAIINGVK